MILEMVMAADVGQHSAQWTYCKPASKKLGTRNRTIDCSMWYLSLGYPDSWF